MKSDFAGVIKAIHESLGVKLVDVGRDGKSLPPKDDVDDIMDGAGEIAGRIMVDVADAALSLMGNPNPFRISTGRAKSASLRNLTWNRRIWMC